MAKKKNHKKYVTQEAFDTLDSTAKSSEHFIERNAKLLSVIFGVLVIATVGYFVYLKLIIQPRNQEAIKEVVTANRMYQQDSMNLALNGSPGAYLGYNQIIKDYSGTDIANIAAFKAGVANYKLGQYEKAIENFKSFSTSEKVMKAVKQGAIGDALVQLNKKEEALSNYINAAKATDIQVIQRLYTRKAAVLGYEIKKYDGAIALLKAYNDEYLEGLGSEMEQLYTLLTNAQQ